MADPEQMPGSAGAVQQVHADLLHGRAIDLGDADLEHHLKRCRDLEPADRYDVQRGVALGDVDTRIERRLHQHFGLGGIFRRAHRAGDHGDLADRLHVDIRVRNRLVDDLVDRADVLVDADVDAIDDRAVGGGGDHRRFAHVLAEQIDRVRVVDVDVSHLRIGRPDRGNAARQVHHLPFADAQ